MPAKMKMINSSENKQIKDDLVEYNLIMQDNRALIEHVLHCIKARARCLRETYTRGLDKQANLFYAAAKLHNRIKRMRISNSERFRAED